MTRHSSKQRRVGSASQNTPKKFSDSTAFWLNVNNNVGTTFNFSYRDLLPSLVASSRPARLTGAVMKFSPTNVDSAFHAVTMSRVQVYAIDPVTSVAVPLNQQVQLSLTNPKTIRLKFPPGFYRWQDSFDTDIAFAIGVFTSKLAVGTTFQIAVDINLTYLLATPFVSTVNTPKSISGVPFTGLRHKKGEIDDDCDFEPMDIDTSAE